MRNQPKKYKYFLGIDMGKDFFEVFALGDPKTHSFQNNRSGFQAFLKTYRQKLPLALMTVEATGGYEKVLLETLIERGLDVHRANPRKVKFFIRSFGIEGKTDASDARALAQYALERHSSLDLYQKPAQDVATLSKLVKRRAELVAIQTQERNRLKGPDRELLKASVQKVLACLKETIVEIETQITAHLRTNDELLKKYNEIQTIPGVGPKVAAALLADLPELGMLSGKKVASLAGVAPHPNQSGKKDGYRKTRGGRVQIKPILFLAALTASRSKSSLGDFYRKLLKQGKKPIVATVALMRKIVVIANAKIRDLLLSPCIST